MYTGACWKNRFGEVMKIDLKTGIIEINGEIIMPGYTFEDFRNTKFYKGQDGIRIIRINDTVQIGKNKFLLRVFSFAIKYCI